MLSDALVRQLSLRTRAMSMEAMWAFGLPSAEVFLPPPAWVASAIRIYCTGHASLVAPNSVNSVESVQALGSLMGMAKMWDAVLHTPPAEIAGMEAQYVKLPKFRAALEKLSSPSIRKIANAERKVDRVPLKPELQLAYLGGKQAGAASILNKDGTMNDDIEIGPTICYFLWVYWPDIRHLSTTSQLLEFFHQMRQDDVTQKNLEKICREIGLKFKGRGRPKNLFKKHAK